MKNAERILLSFAIISIIIKVFTSANFGGVLATISLCTLAFFYSAFGISIFQEGENSFLNIARVRLKFTSISSFVLDILTRASIGTAPIALLAVIENYSWHKQAVGIIIVSSAVLILYLFLNKKVDAQIKEALLIRSSIAAAVGLILKFVPVNF